MSDNLKRAISGACAFAMATGAILSANSTYEIFLAGAVAAIATAVVVQ